MPIYGVMLRLGTFLAEHEGSYIGRLSLQNYYPYHFTFLDPSTITLRDSLHRPIVVVWHHIRGVEISESARSEIQVKF